jgi:hypothetical protein
MYDYTMMDELAKDRYAALLQEAKTTRRALNVPGRNKLLRLVRTLMLVLF